MRQLLVMIVLAAVAIIGMASTAEAGCRGIFSRMQERRAARHDRRAERRDTRGHLFHLHIFHRRAEVDQTPPPLPKEKDDVRLVSNEE